MAALAWMRPPTTAALATRNLVAVKSRVMSPRVHGRIFPETESSALLRRELRILVDLRTIGRETVAHLVELDVLRHYLQDLRPEPCRVTLLAPAANPELRAQYEVFTRLGGETLSYGSVVLPEVSNALGGVPDDFVALMSTAVAADADLVVTEAVPSGVDSQEVRGKLHVAFVDWPTVKRECEIFVRGHEVPWSFACPSWYCPWTPFYSIAEPDTTLIRLWERAGAAGMPPDTLELMRSLALNRHAALSYTRDKLLFYVQQERAAKRHKLHLQDFAFEIGYFLNHYYVLLWAGLDQINWIVNAAFNLEFRTKDWRRVGTLNKDFLRRMRERAQRVADIYEDSDFVRWVKMLAGARHFVAHGGFSMPTELYIRSGDDPSDDNWTRR